MSNFAAWSRYTLINFLVVFPSCYCKFEDASSRAREAICKGINDGPISTCVFGSSDVQDVDFYESSNATQTLLCRDNDYLLFKLNSNATEVFKYVVEIIDGDNRTWIYQLEDKFSNSTIFTIKNLHEGVKYKIRTWLISKSRLQAITSQWISTSNKTDTPLAVKKIWIAEIIPKVDYLDAALRWTPGEDLSCFYSYYYHLRDDIIEGKVDNPRSLHEFTMKKLKYNENYTFIMRAVSRDMTRESEPTVIHFKTPSCLSALKNLSICAPDSPQDLLVTEKYIDSFENYSTFDLSVSWSRPLYSPDGYEISFVSLSESTAFLNVSGDQTNATFTNVKIKHFYQISITAISAKGPSEPSIYNGEIKHTHVKRTRIETYLIIVFVAVGTGIILSLLVTARVLWLRFKKRRRERFENICYFKALKNPAYVESGMDVELRGYAGDELELKSEYVLLQEVVGQGAFGIVRHALLKNKQKEVAVKMFKNVPTLEELRQFQQELEIMKTVGNHPHLVSLIGFCVRSPNGPLLVVEYCAKGDLQSYLKNTWEAIVNNTVQYSNAVNNSNAISNKLYDIEAAKLDMLQPKDLLTFARQIAMGMEYLSSLKIIHRDLAARNVLVCEDKTVKISDFGLSRDVYVDNVYRKSLGGKLPIRWMAIECLTHQQYTTQSDVWSFGILLWEIVNLGGNPYPGIMTEHLLKHLKDGYRMECPSNCENEIYDIMSSCWKTSPKERPTFTELRVTIENLLENETDYLHVDLNTCVEIQNTHQTFTEKLKLPKITFDRYVRPSWNIKN